VQFITGLIEWKCKSDANTPHDTLFNVSKMFPMVLV